jgi:ParB-like nuclease family protein
VSESESKSTSDLPDFIPTHLLQSEPFFERRRGHDAIAPAREGLPPTYRMRADAHYVDELDGPSVGPTVQVLKVDELAANGDAGQASPVLSASIERHGVLQPLLVQRKRGRYRLIDGHKRLLAAAAAGLTDVPCLLHDVDDATAATLAAAANSTRDELAAPAAVSPGLVVGTIGRDVAHSLSAIGSSLNLLSPSAPGLSRRVAVDLIRAELWRVSCLVEAGRVVRADRPAALSFVAPARVLDQVVAQASAEARLRGIDIVVNAIDVPADAAIRADESLLVLAVSSMLLATLALVETAAVPRITLSLSSRSAGYVVFDVSQDALIVPTDWATRALDPAWLDRPGGQSSVVWMLSADRIAAALSGKLAAVATVLGTTISLTLPVATSR